MIPTLTTPKYNITLSTGNTIQFRSFLVKEEKLLLLAQQTGNLADILTAIKEIVKSCTFGAVSVDTLPVIDFIWLLINIRIKSIGEASKFKINCKGDTCKKDIDYSYDLTSIVMPDCKKFLKKTVKLDGHTGIVLRQPTVKVATIALDTTINKVDKEYAGYVDCIESIYSGEQVHTRPDVTDADILTFVDGFTPEQLDPIKEYFNSVPKITKELVIKCPYCGHENKMNLRGIFDFFV